MLIEGLIEERYLEPIAKLCEELGAVHDVDMTAHLRIAPSADGVVVEASLTDGRVAVRHVTSPAQLRTTVEALLVLPPESRPTVPLEKPPPPSESGHALPAHITPTEEQHRLGFEIGSSFVTRLSGATNYLSAGPAVDFGVRSGDWLVGLHLRWEPWQGLLGSPPPGFEMDSVGFGIGVARRLFRAKSAALEAGILATFLDETQSVQFADEERAGTQADVRLGLTTRALIGSHPWFFTPSLEAELSPSRLRRDIRINDALPPLPTWSVALGIGMAWEAQ